MCGIAGFRLTERRHADAELLRRLDAMAATLLHRGPDAQGRWTDGVAGLAHTRLKILDLSEAGRQPMSEATGRVQVSFNGEIYNFAELRRELEQGGARFVSRSDTEVIVHGYLAWGDGVIERLRGMFAIAVWDRAERRLMLARDRIGKKPLSYTRLPDGTFLFGSEIKACLAWPGVPREPDLESIHHYLGLQYVPSPRTAFRGIHKLPPAHRLVLEADGSERLERYWSLPAPSSARARPLDELTEELDALLEESVRLRLVSDVPLGAFLSGGVDSSAVVATMARVAEGAVKTFTIGFHEEDFDETRYARMVAERYGTDHHELVVEPDAAAVLPRIVWHHGEPFADASAIPTYYVSQMARRHVTVALNGDGGDESFLGYPRYLDVERRAARPRLPHPLRPAASRLAERLVGRLGRTPVLRAIPRQLRLAGASDARLYEVSMGYFLDLDKRACYGEALAPYLDRSSIELLAPYFAEAPRPAAGAAWADLHTYLPDDLLVKVDIASMAHALEARSPLLDSEILEWAARVPVDQKLAGGEPKALLKRIMRSRLPDVVLDRPKMGFGVPITHWLANELRELARDCLLSERALARGLIRPDAAHALLDDHVAGRRDNQTRIWALIMLEMWYRQWIDAPIEEALTRPAEVS